MLKRFSVILCLLMLFTLSGCEKDKVQDEKTNSITIGEKANEEEITEKEEKSEEEKETAMLYENMIESDDLYSYEIMINGKHFKIPCKYSEIKEAGWILTDDENTKINPSTYILTGAYLGDSNKYLSLSIINFSNDVKEIKDCYVGGISMDLSYDANKDISILLPQEITFGSTIDEVKSAYGEPTDIYEGEYSLSYTYEVAIYKNVKFEFDVENKKLKSFDLRNLLDEPSDINESSESSSKNNEVLTIDYISPTDLGEDLLSFNVRYEGILYNVPIPFSELEKNGWVIEEAPVDKIEAKGFCGGFYLRKGNNSLQTSLYNPHDVETSIKNCLVTTIITDDSSSKFNLEMSKGITVGATESDLLAAYGEEGLEKDESNNLIYYKYRKDILQQVEFIIRKEDGLVYKINVMNDYK